MRKYTPEEYISAFWSHVNKDGSIPQHCPELGNCWEWVGGKTSDGYGLFGSKNRRVLAHRFTWSVTNGDISVGLSILHKCDNPSCCNPKHLFIGTQQDNVDDREFKGRGNQPKGIKHNKAKLTEAQVLEIRERYAKGGISQSQLAAEYDLQQTNIGFIIRRVTWRHI